MHQPGDGDARVVHQHAIGWVLTQSMFDPQQIRPRRQVRGENFHGAAGVGTQACGLSLQPGSIARHGDRVMAAARQAVSANGANVDGSAGKKRSVCIRHRVTSPIGGQLY
jgi:hypothetical protein